MTRFRTFGCLFVLVLGLGAFLAACDSGGEESETATIGGDDDDSSSSSDDDFDGTGDDDDSNTGDDDADDDDDVDDDADPGLDWVLIPAGEFEMGCSPGDGMCYENESPVRTVILTTDFEIAATETTQDQFEAVMGFNPSDWTSCGVDCPVEGIIWDQADEYCRTIGGRLPTEAEWEYAARAGTTTRYYCGDDPSCLTNIAHYSTDPQNRQTSARPVAMGEPTDFGLFDTSGNVYEAVGGWYYEYSERPDPDIDPQGSEEGVARMVRGGSLHDLEDYQRSSWRGAIPLLERSGLFGFRCARDVEE